MITIWSTKAKLSDISYYLIIFSSFPSKGILFAIFISIGLLICDVLLNWPGC